MVALSIVAVVLVNAHVSETVELVAVVRVRDWPVPVVSVWGRQEHGAELRHGSAHLRCRHCTPTSTTTTSTTTHVIIVVASSMPDCRCPVDGPRQRCQLHHELGHHEVSEYVLTSTPRWRLLLLLLLPWPPPLLLLLTLLLLVVVVLMFVLVLVVVVVLRVQHLKLL